MRRRPPIRIGVIGCSRIARKSVFEAIRSTATARLDFIGSRDPERAKECAQEFGCERSGSYEDVLKSDVDAVYVSLPNTVHEEWVVEAANAGKHVWCEKPAALTYASAQRMVEAAKRNHVRLMEGLMFRHHPQHAKVRELIQNGTLGEPMRVEAFFGFPMPTGGNIVDRQMGGGAYYDACPYPIYASRMIFGTEPVRTLCSMRMNEALGTPNSATMILEYPDGKTAYVSSMFGCYYRSYYRVLGTEGEIRTERAFPVSPEKSVRIFLDRNDKEESFTIEPADHFRLMVEDFCGEITRTAPSLRPYEDDLLAQARVLEAGALSHAQQRTVDMTEIV